MVMRTCWLLLKFKTMACTRCKMLNGLNSRHCSLHFAGSDTYSFTPVTEIRLFFHPHKKMSGESKYRRKIHQPFWKQVLQSSSRGKKINTFFYMARGHIFPPLWQMHSSQLWNYEERPTPLLEAMACLTRI